MNLFLASLGRKSYKPLLVIINGESNSGGYAPNSEAPSGEIGVRNSVQILNNTTLIFENLNIGVNNLLGHSGLSNGVTHGFELELANRADVGGFYNNVHLIKTGQGGSQISQWNVGGGYFNTFTERITEAKELINFNDYNIIVLFSLGINDAIAGTNVNTWKIAVITHFTNLRDVIGVEAPIIMTEFQGMGSGGNQYSTYTTAIQEIASTVSKVCSISTVSAGLRDVNHWNYLGMKLVSGRLLDKAEEL